MAEIKTGEKLRQIGEMNESARSSRSRTEQDERHFPRLRFRRGGRKSSRTETGLRVTLSGERKREERREKRVGRNHTEFARDDRRSEDGSGGTMQHVAHLRTRRFFARSLRTRGNVVFAGTTTIGQSAPRQMQVRSDGGRVKNRPVAASRGGKGGKKRVTRPGIFPFARIREPPPR